MNLAASLRLAPSQRPAIENCSESYHFILRSFARVRVRARRNAIYCGMAMGNREQTLCRLQELQRSYIYLPAKILCAVAQRKRSRFFI